MELTAIDSLPPSTLAECNPWQHIGRTEQLADWVVACKILSSQGAQSWSPATSPKKSQPLWQSCASDVLVACCG